MEKNLTTTLIFSVLVTLFIASNAHHNASHGQTASADTTAASIDSLQRRRNVHGVLNAVGWGILMPLGAMIARYLKLFKSANPAWFYIHVVCQCSAYVIGVAGWATGVKLGIDNAVTWSEGHRNIGMALFSLATLRVISTPVVYMFMFSLGLRPGPDHKYRLHWTIYHRLIAYAIIALSVFNILSGLGLLEPDTRLWSGMFYLLVANGVMSIILEIITWSIYIHKKRKNRKKNSDQNINGVNGANTRTQQDIV
ncbi:hypothetical protein EZV62_020736 [Acer yangbiense]|uniref:Cytochrome b561 domain-containing protein n=1 Tax=Acer yangbiense TaxID=1000413 RepID=A0A5C7HEM8_9ROSI|nr:hypothetical protein EZV62_020736 [Acer yangbiense]